MLDEGVAPTLLQLLQCALCGSKMAAAVADGGGSTSSPSKQKKDKDKDKDKNEGITVNNDFCSVETFFDVLPLISSVTTFSVFET